MMPSKIELMVLACILGVIAAPGIPAYDYLAGTSTTASVVVVEKVYSPSRSSVSPVIGNRNGGVVVHSEAEKFVLIVRDGDHVQSASVEPHVYARAVVGESLEIPAWVGAIDGKVHY